MERPAPKEYAKYYKGYIDLVPKGDILQIFEKQNDQFCEFLAQVNEQKANHRYAKGKWSIKEVIAHIIDVELVFMYRALRFSRKDKTNLPGFEQDDYIKNSDQSHLTLSELVEQFYHMRKASHALFVSFTEDSFTASAAGIIHKDNTTTATSDKWTIDQNKAVRQEIVGY